jgi:hypothetical protein
MQDLLYLVDVLRGLVVQVLYEHVSRKSCKQEGFVIRICQQYDFIQTLARGIYTIHTLLTRQDFSLPKCRTVHSLSFFSDNTPWRTFQYSEFYAERDEATQQEQTSTTTSGFLVFSSMAVYRHGLLIIKPLKGQKQYFSIQPKHLYSKRARLYLKGTVRRDGSGYHNMGDGRIFLKNLRASLFNDDLSNEPNVGRIHLAGQYL